MTTLQKIQRNAMMRAAVAAITATLPITVTPVLFSKRAAAYSNTGVAPFVVSFDACGTTDTETTNPFRDCSYVWFFGEVTGPGVTSWGSNAAIPTASRNVGVGPTAGHVYETPGTYTVTLQVTSALTRNVATTTTTITVLDPAVVYAGTKTVCVSASGDFTGAPAGCVQLTASNTNAIKPYLANGMRFLFRAGETFHQTAVADVINLGTYTGCTLGKYGTGANPLISFDVGDATVALSNAAMGFGIDCRFVGVDVVCRNNLVTAIIDNGAGASGNILTVSSVWGSGPVAALAVGDSLTYAAALTVAQGGPLPNSGVKITADLGGGQYQINTSALVSSATYVTGNGGARGYQVAGTGATFDTETQGFNLLLRCNFQRCWSDIVLDGTAPGVQDCTSSNHSGEPGVFPGAGNTGACAIFHVANGTEYAYVAGNNFDRSFTGEHTGRFQGCSFSLFEANTWKGANATKNLLSTRGMVGSSSGMTSSNYQIRNSVFDPIGGVNITNAVELQLHNVTFYEPIANVLLEANFFKPHNYNASFYAYSDFNILGRNITIRNNAGNHSSTMSTANNSAHRFALIYGQEPGTTTPGSDDILVANNSVYSSTTSRIGMVVDASGQSTWPTNIVVKNNLLYAPSTAGNSSGAQSGWMYSTGNPTPTAVLINNTLDSQVKTANPLFTDPTTFAGFTLGAGSYALAAGMGVNYALGP